MSYITPLLLNACQVLAKCFPNAFRMLSNCSSTLRAPIIHTAVLACALGAGLCTKPAAAQELTISAAASLGNAMRDIGSAYQAVRPGARLNFNFAASGALLAQLQQGAPVDVFASADIDTMDRAEAAKLTRPETRVNFAANELVLVSPLARRPAARTLADLAGDRKAHV